MTVNVENKPPTNVSVSAPPENVTAGNSYTVTASATDPDSTAAVTFSGWAVSDTGTPPDASIASGPCGNPTSGGNKACLQIPSGAGDNAAYTITVTATDGDAGTTTSTGRVFTVNNRPPPAPEAGSPQRVKQGDTVDLTGTAVTDPDGDSLTYSWARANPGGKYVGDVTLTTPVSGDSKKARFTAPTLSSDQNTNLKNTLIFEFTADDSKGGTNADTVTVTVNANPTVNAGPDLNVTAGNAASWTATGSDPDDNVDTSKDPTWSWAVTAKNPTNAPAIALTTGNAGNTATPSYDIPRSAAVGSKYKLTVTFTDDDGVAVTDDVWLNVWNIAPTAKATGTSTAPLDGSKWSYLVDDSVDTDEQWQGIHGCTWTRIDQTETGHYSGTIEFEWVPGTCQGGRFKITGTATADQLIRWQLKVTDSKGGTDTATHTVTVVAP